MTQKKYIIVDLDNCIADDQWRIKFINWEEEDPDKRYHNYHAVSGQDIICNKHILLLDDPDVRLIVFTARPKKYFDTTVDWFSKNGVYDKVLFMLMRQEGDHRHSSTLKSHFLKETKDLIGECWKETIIAAFDDREDVVKMYLDHGINAQVVKIHDVCAYTKPREIDSFQKTLPDQPVAPSMHEATAADILQKMADTFRERNAVYGDNFKMVAKLVKVLFPNGVPPELVVTDQWHLFELKLVKISRFAISELTHMDSIHDDAVYSAMIEAILQNKEKERQQ